MKSKAKVMSKRAAEKRKLPEYISFVVKSGRRQMLIDDLPVKCALKPVDFEVSAGDIRGANPQDPRNCALARACKREGVGDAVVYGSRIFLRPKGASHWERMGMSPSMRVEAYSLDRGGRVSPGPQRAVPLSPAARKAYSEGRRHGSAVPGARDKGSSDRTPSSQRAAPQWVPDVRHWASPPKPRKMRVAPA